MKSIKLKVTKKIDYPSFFNVLITKKVSDELNLNKDLPYVEITEIIKNRIAVYKKETQPVVDYYKDKLITIKAEGGEQPEDIAADIIREIKKRDENF